MDRIILFDIDKTLFDREGYLQNFFGVLKRDYNLTDEEVDEVGKIYDGVKEEYGYFSSSALLAKVYAKHPNLSGKLDYYFKSENLERFLFEDSKIIFEIKDASVGIFSKGDIGLQEIKITKFENLIDKSLVFIFHDKLKKISEVLGNLSDSEIFLVDDNIAVLVNAKEINKNVITVLIDRKSEFSDPVNGVDFKISSLSDIIPILNEKNT